MNFQPSDYLSNLNLVFDNAGSSPVEDASQHAADLDFFSQADFFDLDVFSNDFSASQKQNMTLPLPPAQPQNAPQYQQQSHMPVPSVKMEHDDRVAAAAHVHHELNSAVAGPYGAGNVAQFSPGPTHLVAALASAGVSPASSVSEVGEYADMEVKRRRNTAASARFRIKKKLKEKQMEERAQSLQDRLSQLEKKLRTLEMENKCLRQLIVEKTDKKNCDLLETIKKRSLGSEGPERTAFTYTN